MYPLPLVAVGELSIVYSVPETGLSRYHTLGCIRVATNFCKTNPRWGIITPLLQGEKKKKIIIKPPKRVKWSSEAVDFFFSFCFFFFFPLPWCGCMPLPLSAARRSLRPAPRRSFAAAAGALPGRAALPGQGEGSLTSRAQSQVFLAVRTWPVPKPGVVPSLPLVPGRPRAPSSRRCRGTGRANKAAGRRTERGSGGSRTLCRTWYRLCVRTSLMASTSAGDSLCARWFLPLL